ncbi:MAG: SH3 domain-containing protein [Clostridia bacterium]|nr:SH3 domain-containing protein [Clostridia bacterium]
MSRGEKCVQRFWQVLLVLAALLLAGLIAGNGMIPKAAAEEDTRTVYVLVSEDSVLNVRMLPKLGADVLFCADRGDPLLVQSIQKDGWVEVSRAGDYGYCRIEYLSDEPPGEPEAYTTTVGELRLRRVPGGETLRKLDKDIPVTVLGRVTDQDGVQWARLTDGFVMARFLTRATDSNEGSQ